jgi:SOS response regulatory protein OraA/RecX
MKTATIRLESIKDSDGWMELAYDLLFEKFKTEHPDLNEDDASDKFYQEVVSKKFRYGEYANLEIKVDENFNIIGGKIL